MTQHELLEEGIDLERGAKRIAEINAAKPKYEHGGSPMSLQEIADSEQLPPAREPRSDKGVPRETLYITPAKGVRLDISEPTGRAYLCDIMDKYVKDKLIDELASIGAQLLAIIERRK